MKSIFHKFSFLFVALIYLSGCSTINPAADLPIKKQDVDSFKPVAADVAKLNEQYGVDNVLVVLDIDNTLLTTDVDLGGDIWYQWQRGKLAVKPANDDKVSCLFADNIGLLYELGTMHLTEEDLPRVIKNWQTGGNTVFALTSRAPQYRAATERELGRAGIEFESSALAPAGEESPVYREMLEREYSYMTGIMMTTGMNKGDMLNLILEKTDRHFEAIVFVDDSSKNVMDVFNKFQDRKDINTNIYHYVKVEEEREGANGAILTQTQTDKMAASWAELDKMLKTIFPGRNLSEGCLTVN
jgi:hypothetical protein